MAQQDNTTLLAVGAALGVGLIAFSAFAQPKKKPGCNMGDFKIPPPEVLEDAIKDALDAGARSHRNVTDNVAASLYPNNQWPPAPADSKARCFYDEIAALIKEWLDGQEIPPWPACDLGTKLNDSADQCVPGIDLKPYENAEGRPEHGKFYQVKFGDILLGENPNKSIIWQALFSAAYQAARTFGNLGENAAEDFAEEVADQNQLRVDYLDLVQCSQYNDALYMTYGYGAQSFAGPNGRALRLLPYHYNNRKRMTNGLPPERNIELKTPADKNEGNAGKISKGQGSFSYLWMPRLNLKVLWEQRDKLNTNQREDMLTTLGQGAQWPDNVPGYEPPPEVRTFGLPQGDWGC